jgi:hypothetical protein
MDNSALPLETRQQMLALTPLTSELLHLFMILKSIQYVYFFDINPINPIQSNQINRINQSINQSV